MKRSRMFGIFEDLYRANRRECLFDLDTILAEIEALPQPSGEGTRQVQESLRGAYADALTVVELHTEALRARLAALPQLPARKEVNDGA